MTRPRVREAAVQEYLDAIAARTPAPAGGAGAALAGAVAAALAELAARVSGDEASAARAQELRARLLALADEDADAYSEYLRDKSEANRLRTIDVPRAIAAAASEVGRVAGAVMAHGKRSVVGDAEVAVALAATVTASATRLAEINLPERGEQ